MQCSNNLKQLTLSLHGYHDIHDAFPAKMSGKMRGAWGNRSGSGSENCDWSAHLHLLPFIELGTKYDEITASSVTYPRDRTTTRFNTRLGAFLCPSDGGGNSIEYMTTNYMICLSDVMYDSESSSNDFIKRSVFVRKDWRGMNFISDGTSNTLAFSEAVMGTNGNYSMVKGGVQRGIANANENPGIKCNPAIVAPGGELTSPYDFTDESYKYNLANGNRRGGRLHDGSALTTGFSASTPPNFPSCFSKQGGSKEEDPQWKWGVYPANSQHSGGANVALFDGSVRFVPDTVDFNGGTLTESKTGPSNFGVWGAMGSPCGAESESL